MLLFAISVIEKIKQIPRKNLINLGLLLLLILVIALIVRQARKMNKFILMAIIFVTGTVFCFNWIYQRNEPKFLTPFVDLIAPFFPSAPSKKDHW